ncbi:hypothetical protein Tco_0062864, partial [Tanacetum coccineum]
QDNYITIRVGITIPPSHSNAEDNREKDRETRPVSQSCPKEVSLKDRVKALEALCDSVMILPKEIRSLKARVVTKKGLKSEAQG